MLNGDQKAIRMEMVGNSISAADKYLYLLGRIVTGDEKWCVFIRPTIRKYISNLETTQSPGCRFQSADEVKSVSQTELKNVAKNGFQKCFDDLHNRRSMSVVAQGSYFEVGCVSAI
ncbi:hypothetical protein TNCV_4906781 [Trichonephila clavipes]|uniref:Uncharacterized protein n=1 Tax=Trichonephila clavipes TaxID=2585209 RepID=A0A8X6V864_TRICX|nr:hypothetical protein TNCV_4906781 [Trichonephila clavipes]